MVARAKLNVGGKLYHRIGERWYRRQGSRTKSNLFDEWEAGPEGVLADSSELAPRIGTVDWLFRDTSRAKHTWKGIGCGLV